MNQRNKIKVITIQSSLIRVIKIEGKDYICLTDMTKNFGGSRVIENWLRNKNTLEFLGVWEQLNNLDFNSLEFGGIKNMAGLNRFTISVKEWILKTKAKGLIAKSGRYGATYAHKDIAFEFGTWLSPEFKLLIINEFQRLKAKEMEFEEWDSRRYLSRINYKLHTKSIKEILLPYLNIAKNKHNLIYADEADMLNEIVFAKTALEWKKEHPIEAKKGYNQRDFASMTQLVILANIESLNSMLITERKNQSDRYVLLVEEAERQYQALLTVNEINEQKQIN